MLKNEFNIPFSEGTLHEFVISMKDFADKGVKAHDFAKAIIDSGMHPPTVYFPLNVKEAMMIEPTETESAETLDRFAETLIRLKNLALSNPEKFQDFPETTEVCRPDEKRAVKQPNLCSKA